MGTQQSHAPGMPNNAQLPVINCQFWQGGEHRADTCPETILNSRNAPHTLVCLTLHSHAWSDHLKSLVEDHDTHIASVKRSSSRAAQCRRLRIISHYFRTQRTQGILGISENSGGKVSFRDFFGIQAAPDSKWTSLKSSS